MKRKYAVALINGENEKIMGLFKTKEEADEFGVNNLISHNAGLQYCFSAVFSKGKPIGKIKVYDYYNVAISENYCSVRA